jgi:hypothetical protein
MGLAAANALRPLAINKYTERPRGRRPTGQEHGGLSERPAQLSYSEAPAHRGPRHHTAVMIQARDAPPLND